jgi:hypothetical protein
MNTYLADVYANTKSAMTTEDQERPGGRWMTAPQ